MSKPAEEGNTSPNATIQLQGQPLEVTMHPTGDIVATALLTGEVHCLSYTAENDVITSTPLFDMTDHKKSVRSVDFSQDGCTLFSASKDRSWIMTDTTTGKAIHSAQRCHEVGINRIRSLTETMFTTGDDEGVVKIWDSRTNKEAQSYHENEDFISNFDFHLQKKQLLVAGGDGFLSIFDIRKPNLLARSDNMDDELLSVKIVKGGKKVVVGTQDGPLALFTYGDWGDLNDRFVGHPSSVDALCLIDEDTILTGSSDGLIRVCGLLPNKMYGVVGALDLPVEGLSLDRDRKWLTSIGHDNAIRFWDVAFLTEEGNDDDEEEEGEDDSDDSDDEGWEDAVPAKPTLDLKGAVATTTKDAERGTEEEPDTDGASEVDQELEDKPQAKRPVDDAPVASKAPPKNKKKLRMEKKEKADKAAKESASFFSDL